VASLLSLVVIQLEPFAGVELLFPINVAASSGAHYGINRMTCHSIDSELNDHRRSGVHVRMRTAALLSLLLCHHSMCVADEHAEILKTLSDAYDRHKSSWTSGRVTFKESLIFDNSEPHVMEMEMEGEVEWRDDYFHCIVDRKEKVPPTNRRIRVLRSHGMQLVWIENLETSQTDPERLSVYLLPERPMNRQNLKRIQPNPQIWFSSKCLTNMSPWQASFEIAEAGKTLRFARTINQEQPLVHQFRRYQDTDPPLEIEEWFDLNKSGLLTECRFADPNSGEGLYRHTKLNWQQAADGRWFPATLDEVSRSGSWSSKPRYTAKLQILSSEPLVRPRYTSAPNLSTFGPLPDNVSIVTIGPDGKERSQVRKSARSTSIEAQLRLQAGRLRGKGFLNQKASK
jgi:hypothetical protein